MRWRNVSNGKRTAHLDFIPSAVEPSTYATDLSAEQLQQFITVTHDSAVLWSGPRRLLLAVLEDAVACWSRYLHAHSPRERQMFRETQDWFWAKDQPGLFAFESICQHLALDPDSIRCRLICLQTTGRGRSLSSLSMLAGTVISRLGS